MKNLSEIQNHLQERDELFRESLTLTEKMNLTDQERRRLSWITNRLAAVRDGISFADQNAAQLAGLRKELGISENEVDELRVTNPRAVREWHALLASAKGYKGLVAKKAIRSNAAGTQSLSYTEGSEGGNLVPFGFDARQDVLMSKYSMDDIVTAPFCTEFETGRGNPMATPVVDDIVTTGSSPVVFTTGASTIVGENTSDNTQDIQTNAVQWGAAPMFRSGIILISWELFEDAQYGVEGVAGLVEAVVARRHAIGLGARMITGTGLSGGLTKTLPAAQTIISTASTLALADFINLYEQLGVQYRKNSVWYMHSNTQIALYKLLQTSGRAATELPTSFMGRPIAVCNSMNAQGAGVPNVVVLADPGYLQKRKAGSELQVYHERFADYGQVGFQGLMRADFNVALFNSEIPPVAAMNQHS